VSEAGPGCLAIAHSRSVLGKRAAFEFHSVMALVGRERTPYCVAASACLQQRRERELKRAPQSVGYTQSLYSTWVRPEGFSTVPVHSLTSARHLVIQIRKVTNVDYLLTSLRRAGPR